MYERNAIVLERYYNQMFGYNMKNNIQTNFKNYTELVECLEKYRNISEEEETIMQEYDSIANRIREIQKKEEILDKKNNKYQEERANIFQNIDENAEAIQRKIDNVNNNIENLNEEIKENAEQFVKIVDEFNEKTMVRTACGRSRRNVENEYNTKLNETLDNYKDIDAKFVRRAKQFAEIETDEIEEELKDKIEKNGEKEKIPFNIEVIKKAITLSVDIQKRKTDILANIYEKTNKLFTEIKNNTTKGDKHKKIIKDAKSKLEFVGAIEEYLIQFLDNERLTAVNGQEEHKKLMKEACKNLDEDLLQINNLYTLLLKEISRKITKKTYAELYNLDYLKDLETKSEEFEAEIKKLNLPVTIINPNYWRIEGMKKIYDVFYKCVTEEYGRDLSEYFPKDEEQEEQEDAHEELDIELEEQQKEEKQENEKIIKKARKPKSLKKEDDVKAEIDKKIDMILGFDDEEENDNWNDDIEDFEDEYQENDEEDEDWEDDDYDETEDDWDDDFEDDEDNDFDIWGNNIKQSKKAEEDDDDWGEDEIDEIEDDFEEEEEEPKIAPKRSAREEEWENKFIKIQEKNRKKKSFFDKFKK
jgi:hypothetical protein